MLRRILNIVIVFQYSFEARINAYKRRLLNESFFADNRDKTLIIIKKLVIITLKECERFLKRSRINSSLS